MGTALQKCPSPSCSPIAITGEDSICADGSTKFEAELTATGTNYTYQWYKGTAIGDETMISGQTGLVLSGVSEANTLEER